MNRKKLISLAVTAGLVAIGVAVAAPALAGNGPGPGGADHPAERLLDGPQYLGPRAGHGPGEQSGRGWGDGTCLVPDVPAGDLTDAQASTLASLAEQQKLASDLAAEFAEQYDARIFDRVATGEARQLDTLSRLLVRYQVDDPTDGLAAGEFADPQLQARYDQLLADGSVDLAAALEVGQTLAQEQISALEVALDGVDTPDLTMVYEHLLTASQRQLDGFEAWSGS
jgi:hypothetical protein